MSTQRLNAKGVSQACGDSNGWHHHFGVPSYEGEEYDDYELCPGCACPCHRLDTATTLSGLQQILVDCTQILDNIGGHIIADLALLRYINDETITDTFTKMPKYYA